MRRSRSMAEWFRHDVHCLQDDRLFALVSRYGAEGYAVFFHTVETMYANNGDPISDITVRRIAFELSMPFDKVIGIIEFASSESCGNLFESRPEGYVSDRVLREIEFQESQRMRYSNMGKASAERRLKDKYNAGSTQVEHKLNAGSTHNITRHNKDNNVSRDYQEEILSINKKSSTDKTDIVCSEPSDGLKLEAENPPSSDPVFLTITTNRKEEFPIHESDVQFWEETYPGVDVRSELRKIKAWSRDNASQRKTAKGMKGFCNRWLSREQDRAGTRQDSNVKGAPVRMSLVADGTREGNKERRPVFK